MKLFEMQYVDMKGRLIDLNAKNKEGKPILNDGTGTWEFKYRIVAYILLAIILPPMLIIAGICGLVKMLCEGAGYLVNGF